MFRNDIFICILQRTARTIFGFELYLDYFVNRPGNAFNDVSTPKSLWSDGSYSGLDLRDISVFGPQMTYNLGQPQLTAVNSPKSSALEWNQGKLNLNIENAGTYTIQMMNIRGEVLYKKTQSFLAGKTSLSLGISQAGIYLLEVKGEGSQSTMKILVD